MNLHLLFDYPKFLIQLLNGSRTESELRGAERRSRDITPHLERKENLKILDVGSGALRPQYSILQSQGHHVVGVDLVNEPSGGIRSKLYILARYLFRRPLRASGHPISDSTLVCADVGALPFHTDAFDLVTSVAAFEHFLDIPSVVEELQRCLVPGGVAWIMIHLFTSPSGGHNVTRDLNAIQTLPPGVEPWDHLRKRKLAFHVPLNEYRIADYLAAFETHFEVVNHYCAGKEGEHLLTPEIRAELAEYSEEELTCGCYVIVAKNAKPS